MIKKENRRSFLKKLALGGLSATTLPNAFLKQQKDGKFFGRKGSESLKNTGERGYNEPYKQEYLNHVAFPIGGIGAGMFCLEGRGTISHLWIATLSEGRISNSLPVWACRFKGYRCTACCSNYRMESFHSGRRRQFKFTSRCLGIFV